MGYSVAIAGGGLSGLCLAQALHRAEFDVRVYERDPAPDARRQGYRVTVDAHGTAALQQCLPARLFEAVLATASRPFETGYFRFTNWNLGEIFTLTFRHDLSNNDRRPIGQVDRATLRAIMLSGLEGKVHFGQEAVRVEATAGESILHFANGESTGASVVVGADGVRSRLRDVVFPSCPVIDTGFRGIYGKTPLGKGGKAVVPAALENSGVMALGKKPGRSFFFTSMRFNEPPQEAFARLVPNQQAPTTGDYVMWAVMFPNGDLNEDVGELGGGALHSLALNAARDFHPVLQRLVERADVDYTIGTRVSAATRPSEWAATGVTLMGDAVHVMPPTGAHGGNTALRDAALLSGKLKDAKERDLSMNEAIQAYQREMIEYAFQEVERSVKTLRRGSISNPLIRLALLRVLPWLRSSRAIPLPTREDLDDLAKS